MEEKKFIKILGFLPKDNVSDVFYKKYGDYVIEVDFQEKQFNFGSKIVAESKTTQNFSQPENWVVLECVDRLLGKGYKPENITLEKTWKTGHGTSGRLDILVNRDDGSAYLMIECKTWGKEFEKEFKSLQKNGGQLFTYFQQDKNAEILLLYASIFDGKEIKYKNEIIKIEEDYRQTGNVKDLYERWNKLTKSNGIFDNWTSPYEFQSKALTKNDLKVLKQEDGSFIFNRFLEILRHNVVSDKPNAFNKIFTLFLCKIVDENRNKDEQLEFQWIEGEDNHVKFQKRLTDLYRRGMDELLGKKVSDVSDDEFDIRFQQVEERYRTEIKDILTEIRLKKNNEFAIKEVFDDASFQENAKVVKEIVELLQVYQIRYTYRQQFLSDFFELLLTTGLKQESGQFFTPVPIARFIIKSLPISEITKAKIEAGNRDNLLPNIIDYAAGSGHFITESMEEIQKYIEKLDEDKFNPTTKKALKKWKDDQFDWADDYVYAIEKDYRLVKTAKVSCYLHGDGLAKVIHGDGLGDFATSVEFKDLLKITDRVYPQDNKQFDIVISNPPYSVSAFKGQMNEEKAKSGFDLYGRLTDQSSEIECLFIERTKQLLKDDGVAGIILPSSILSNSGIYIQTREIILKYFEILGITELGSNTFMATGTNTVILFLRRRNNAIAYNVQEAVKKSFLSLQDVTINGIERPIAKYLFHVWEAVSFQDYQTLLQKNPNEIIRQHEIYKEYEQKIKAKNVDEKLSKLIDIEKEKLIYFILAYRQKVVLVKTGQKAKEKQFLGYEFSTRRGSEGIHPIQRNKTIDDCTQLYDIDNLENENKASTYIYRAFTQNKFDCEIPDNLKKNISYQNLVDMLTFDRVDFEKNISLSSKRKVKIESKWGIVSISKVAETQYGFTEKALDNGEVRYLRITDLNEDGTIKDNKDAKYINPNDDVKSQFSLNNNDIVIARSGSVGKSAIYKTNKYEDMIFASYLIRLKVNEKIILADYLFYLTKTWIYWEQVAKNSIAVTQPNLNAEKIKAFSIPLPPLEVQAKIVAEIESLEKQEEKAKANIESLSSKVKNIINNLNQYSYELLVNISKNLDYVRKPVTKGDRLNGEIPYYGASGIVDYVSDYLLDDYVLLISEDGANLKSRVTPIAFTASGKIWVNNHAHILKFEQRATHKLVELYLNNCDISEFITGQAQPKLNQQNLNSIKIPLPPIEEQKKIVSEIEKIELQITELEKQTAEIPKQKEAILKKYL